MAKSARASTVKRNNASLRKKVFGPAHDARTERLSARLQELAAAPKPESEKRMEVDEDEDKGKDAAGPDTKEEKDVDMAGNPIITKTKSRKPSGRIHKKAPRKAKHAMVFSSDTARKRRQVRGRKG